MANTYSTTFSRKAPDVIMEELAIIFSKKTSFEFKPLFDMLYTRLRARKFTTGGEEMLRLRVYEKLQGMVSRGAVKKTITNEITKTYRGIPAPLRVLSQQLKSFRSELAARLVLKRAAI